MPNNDLQVYMSDHLAGAAAGLEMVEHLVGSSDSPDERESFQRLHDEIASDRKQLEEMLERLGGHPSAMRQAGGWLAEKMVALKMRWDDPGGRRLNYLQALESLALGVLGKRALWRVLRAAAGAVPELQGYSFEELERRAQDQFERIETRRIAAGRRLFATGSQRS